MLLKTTEQIEPKYGSWDEKIVLLKWFYLSSALKESVRKFQFSHRTAAEVLGPRQPKL